jgi:hypothetical protein
MLFGMVLCKSVTCNRESFVQLPEFEFQQLNLYLKYYLLPSLLKDASADLYNYSSVSIALGYRLDDRVCRVRFPEGAGNFCLHHSVQNGSGTHPASYPRGTAGYFPGGKAAGA